MVNFAGGVASSEVAGARMAKDNVTARITIINCRMGLFIVRMGLGMLIGVGDWL
jgi:hypothetical protein